MTALRGISRICYITSSAESEQALSGLLEAGIRWIQYREKQKSKRELFFEALRLREMTRRFDACLIINDHADIALAVDADGVHLGQEDLPLHEARKIMGGRIIGISTHSLSEALEAERGVADYVGYGPVFHTTTKDAGEPKGIDSLRMIREALSIPVIALGGITVENVASVSRTGCYGVAVSSGLSGSGSREKAQKFLSILHDRP